MQKYFLKLALFLEFDFKLPLSQRIEIINFIIISCVFSRIFKIQLFLEYANSLEEKFINS
jgi:hypothetical protein